MKQPLKIACLGDAQTNHWFEKLRYQLKQFIDNTLAPDHDLTFSFLRSSLPSDLQFFPTELIRIYGLRHLHYNHQIQLASQANLTIMIGQDYHPLDDYTKDFFAKITQISPNIILWFTPDHAESLIPSKAQIESKTNVIPASHMTPETLAKLTLYLLTPNRLLYAKDQTTEQTETDEPPDTSTAPTQDDLTPPQ